MRAPRRTTSAPQLQLQRHQPSAILLGLLVVGLSARSITSKWPNRMPARSISSRRER
jgi:hypothetical protein